jgi:hypothetical protein
VAWLLWGLFSMSDTPGRLFGCVALAAVLLACASPALAQLPLSEPPAPFVREAFASPYGRALVAELGKMLRADADPACLQSKNTAAEQLPERGEQLIIAWGIRAMEKQSSLLDPKAHEEAFTKSAGRNATAELKRLRENADVMRYLAIERPARLAKVLDFIFEQFDRHLLVERVKLRAISPLGTGNVALADENPTDEVEEALETFLKGKKKSASLQRFLALSEKSAEAIKPSIKRDEAAQAGPRAFFGGVEADLADLCIGKR